MNLLWKLLRSNISIPQMLGFFFANLLGVFIILFGFQFYRDIFPSFTGQDKLMKGNYLILNKKIAVTNSLTGRNSNFTNEDINELSSQPFIKDIGEFHSANFKVEAQMGINGINLLQSEIPIESVPDKFIDIPLNQWDYLENSKVVPVILPRSYVTMYNFGFASNHSLPKINEGLIGLIDFKLIIEGNNKEDVLKGKIIGFSNRLNSILVPEKFMELCNKKYSVGDEMRPSRLIIETKNISDNQVYKYVDKKGYELQDHDKELDRIISFFKFLVGFVIVIGLIISALSIYILILSIYLLLQKNSRKLENLILIGYSPTTISMPYVFLNIAVNTCILVFSLSFLWILRESYLNTLQQLFPDLTPGSMLPSCLLGFCLLVVIVILNIAIIRNKILAMAVYQRNKK